MELASLEATFFSTIAQKAADGLIHYASEAIPDERAILECAIAAPTAGTPPPASTTGAFFESMFLHSQTYIYNKKTALVPWTSDNSV